MNPTWKPAACGCGAPHPSFSRDGSAGPWRCWKCHALAVASAPRARPEAPSTAPVVPSAQGSLL